MPMISRVRNCALAALVLMLPVVDAAAQREHVTIPQQPCPPTRGSLATAVVLDFSVAPRVSEKRDCCTRKINFLEEEVKTGQDRRGWWLGRQDIYVNANVGRMASDLINERLQADHVFNMVSRGDLKYYYADKKDALRAKLKLNDEELKKAILLLDPVSIGREMGVDKVVVGHICDSELRKAVAPGSFASVASFNIAVFDVKSGHIEFDQCYAKIRNHSTQYFHYEKIAEEVSEDLLMGQRNLKAGRYR